MILTVPWSTEKNEYNNKKVFLDFVLIKESKIKMKRQVNMKGRGS